MSLPRRRTVPKRLSEMARERVLRDESEGREIRPVELPGKAELVKILRAHPLVRLRDRVKRVFVLGSFARGTPVADSDLDVMLEIAPRVGWTASQVADWYRRKIQQFFVEHDVRGHADHLHPQWRGRRVDVYFTYDAEIDLDGPAVEVS